MSEYSVNSASTPENRSESSAGKHDTPSLGVPLSIGSFSVDDAIQMHLVDCDQCRKATDAGPVPIGQKSAHCNTYWHLQLMRAQYEGQVNNIVHWTEFGDEAPVRGQLE